MNILLIVIIYPISVVVVRNIMRNYCINTKIDPDAEVLIYAICPVINSIIALTFVISKVITIVWISAHNLFHRIFKNGFLFWFFHLDKM